MYMCVFVAPLLDEVLLEEELLDEVLLEEELLERGPA